MATEKEEGEGGSIKRKEEMKGKVIGSDSTRDGVKVREEELVRKEKEE